jgi:hypothetical protein
MLSSNGTLSIATHFQSRGKDVGAANLNMVSSSLEGLTPLPDLNELTLWLKENGFSKIQTQRLMPASTFYGINASIV